MLAPFKDSKVSIPAGWEGLSPPRLEDFEGRITVVFNHRVVARAYHAKRIVEADSASTYFLPLETIQNVTLAGTDGLCWCNWRGRGQYFDVVVQGFRARRGAWQFPTPGPGYESLKGYIAFDAGRMDACFVDGQEVKQQGGVYGGWILDRRH